MKLLFILLISFSLHAKVSIISHDGSRAFNYHLDKSDIGHSVGEVTINALEHFSINYQGNERGINSILNSPLGSDALIVISDLEMKAYGWCFKINGFSPEFYPDEVFIEDQSDEILWFWGYAHYKHGEWIAQCVQATISP